MKDMYYQLAIPSLTQVVKSFFPDADKFTKQKPLKVVIFGFFGMENVGDDVILAVEVNELQNLQYPLEVYVPSQHPEKVEEFAEVIPFATREILTFIKAVITSDVIVFGGGGLVCKARRNLPFAKVVFDFAFNVYKVLLLFWLPSLLGKRIVVFGVGIYPNISWFQKILFIPAFKLADFVSVRDRISFEFLTQQGVSEVKYQKDVAFLLDSGQISDAEKKQTARIIPETGKRNIGISLVSTHKSYDKLILTELKKVIEKYKGTCNFYFFPFNVDSTITNDLMLGKQLQRSLSDPNLLSFIPYEIGSETFFNLFNRLDGAINMRFHSLIFAYRNGVPFVGISYDRKCASFMDEISVAYLELEEMNTQNVSQLFKKHIHAVVSQAEGST